MASDTAFADGINLLTSTVGACTAAVVAWTGESKEMDAVVKDLAKIGTTVMAVEKLTEAIQKQNLALLKNPFVAATAAILAMGVAAVQLYKHLTDLSAAEKAVQEVQKAGRDNAAKEIARIDTLNNILHDNTRSLEERKNALSEIQSLVPNYHGALTTEGTLIDDNTAALDEYVQSLLRAATAQAAFDKMVDLQKQKMEAQTKLAEAQRDLSRFDATMPTGVVTGGAGSISGMAASGMNRAPYQQAVNSAERAVSEIDKQLDAVRQYIEASDLSVGTKGGRTTSTGGGTQKELTALQEVQKQIADLSNEALTADETRREEIRQQIAALQQQEAEYKKILDYVKGINQETEPRTYDVTFAGPEQSPFEALQQSISIKLADQAAMVDENSLRSLMTVAIQNGIDSINPDFAVLQAKMAEGMDIPDEAWKQLEDTINAHLKTLGLDPIKLDISTGAVKTAETEAKTLEFGWVKAAQAVEQVGSAIQSIEDPSAKIAGIIASAIANVAAGLGGILSSQEAMANPWNWVALALSGTATMISTVSAIKSATAGSYAQGGRIEGNSYSGDNMRGILPSGELIGLDAGEIVLNHAQQTNVARDLQGGGGAAIADRPDYVTGENIVLGVNNHLKRIGKGEIVTTAMLRRAGINIG
jgi:hypothetical protein